MVKLRVKVGPKGQIVIPKVFREAYRIKEGGYAIIEPTENGLIIRGVEDPSQVIKWIRERRRKLQGKEARLGDLAKIDLEEEFDS
ncbi:AbrB/MazE/SpoVT family DNA-binding domain-containing protein [Desulfurococcaceae archaeon MEX13E-LK6-19]|nr:AbrB/MazE/SpoVT family DNA-binding domain-containing protein [Desulfurococcaceae archaeon MEX13E-LK6-19]